MRRRELTAVDQVHQPRTALGAGVDVDPNRNQSVYHHHEKSHIPIID